MKRLLLVLGLWAVAPLLMAPGNWGTRNISPFLSHVTDSGVTIQWETPTASTTRVTYGVSPDTLDKTVDDPLLVNLHRVVLTDLPPNSTVYYRAFSDLDNGGPLVATSVKSFYTYRQRPEPFRFVHFGETHSNPGLRTATQADFLPAVQAWDPHLRTDAGDHVNDGEDLDQWQTYFTEATPMIESIPILNAWGNHDDADGAPSAADEVALLYFDQPGNGRYYAHRYSNTLFIALDMMWSYDGRSAEMLTWLEGVLAEASDGQYDPAFIVVFFHPPLFGANKYAGSCANDTSTQWLHANLRPLFEQYHVSLVLGGHEMLYHRATANGVTYVQVTSSDKLREIDCPAVETDVVSMSPSILRVDVACQSLSAEGYALEGLTFQDTWLTTTGEGVADTFTISARLDTDCFYDYDKDGYGDHEDCDDSDESVWNDCTGNPGDPGDPGDPGAPADPPAHTAGCQCGLNAAPTSAPVWWAFGVFAVGLVWLRRQRR